MVGRYSRRHDLLQGIASTAVSALAFVSIFMHRSSPHLLTNSKVHAVGTYPMPVWMAVGVASLFGFIGLASLIPAALNIQVPRNVATAMALLIGTCFLGFFDAVCIRCWVVGIRHVQIPFVPDGVNTLLSGALWGIFVLFFSGFAIGCFVGIFKSLGRSGEHV